jgi:hypothetical protein
METHRVTVLDTVMATVLVRHRLTFKGFKLTDDVFLPDGTIDVNVRIPPKTTTPSRQRTWFLRQLSEFGTDGAGWLQRMDEWAASTTTRIDPSNKSRTQTATAGRVVDQLHQATFRVVETTPN